MKTLSFSRCTQALLGVLVVALGVALAQPVLAQSLRTLQIEDGIVSIDDEPIPEEDLPDSLVIPTDDIYRFSFTPGKEPIIELGGRFFTVKGKQLVEISQADVEAMGGLPGGVTSNLRYADALRSHSSATLGRGFVTATPRSGAFGSRLQLLTPSSGTSWVVRPQTETQRYLSAMQQGNKDLYERLMKERELEAKSQMLAARIRALTEDDPERKALTEELRQQLDEIFVLKEENRRRETEQLEKELKVLRDQLSKREEKREQIIERRLNELLGRPQDLEW
ncbi:MAG: hypothetical protein ACR2GR_06600 [Rhodothermales bacterium]